MTRLALWPDAVRMDFAGNTIDEYQGMYSRGLCRAFAEAVVRTRICEAAVCLPIVTVGGTRNWAVTGREWLTDEALAKPSPNGTDFMTWGTMSLSSRLEFHVMLASRSEGKLVVDRQFNYGREQIPNCLSEAVSAITSAIAGRALSDEEFRQMQMWGTNRSEAYLAYLAAWSADAAHRFGVAVTTPNGVSEWAAKVAAADPAFAEARGFGVSPGAIELRGCPDDESGSAGYSEVVFPVSVRA
jgi:hypothetical protein